ncbi:unnamed protein product [Parajaminaea phylloscopi]
MLARCSGASTRLAGDAAPLQQRSYHRYTGHGQQIIAATRTAHTTEDRQLSLTWAACAAVVAAGAAWKVREPVKCERVAPAESPLRSYASANSTSKVEEPQSIVNAYQLSFGAICGICAGVFIKKGLKLIAFFLGGGFILLQYLSQQRLVSVDWQKIGSRYNSALESSAGGPADPSARGWSNSTAARIYARFVDFLTANFQERATLLAGLALGLRLG